MGKGERVLCPRCGGFSWLEHSRAGLVQRCLCGLHKPVIRQAEGTITIIQTAVRPCDVLLPARGTKTRRCLLAVAVPDPGEITTGEVATSSGLNNKETAALLVTLMARGLVERVQERRGLVGGSTWRLTVASRTLLKR